MIKIFKGAFMKKIICLIMVVTGLNNLSSNDNSQLTQSTNQLLTRLINKNIDNQSIDDLIATLETENKKLLMDIVRLQIDLAKMRVNGGGKGPIKPKLQQAAQQIIETIQNKNRKIAHNKAAIQALILSDPSRQLNSPIYAKPLQYYKKTEKEIKVEDKKKK